VIDDGVIRQRIVDGDYAIFADIPEFDAWLRSVKADAWDEGFDSGHYAADWESRDCDCRKNPYPSTKEWIVSE
jgi:hypothetical protein